VYEAALLLLPALARVSRRTCLNKNKSVLRMSSTAISIIHLDPSGLEASLLNFPSGKVLSTCMIVLIGNTAFLLRSSQLPVTFDDS
jgi:hypothetical protein